MCGHGFKCRGFGRHRCSGACTRPTVPAHQRFQHMCLRSRRFEIHRMWNNIMSRDPLFPISIWGPRDLRGSGSPGQDRCVCVCVCACVCVCVCVCVGVCAHSVLEEGGCDFSSSAVFILFFTCVSLGSPGNTWVASGAVEYLYPFVEFSGQISSSCHFFITTFPPFSVGGQPLLCVSSNVPELEVWARPQSSLLAGRCILNYFTLEKEYALFCVFAQNQHF